MADLAMRRSAQVTLDGSGYGAVRIAPVGKAWTINYMAVAVSTNSNEAQCKTYQNQIGSGYVIDSTVQGSTGDTTDTVITVLDGYCIWIEWTGGDPGAVATVTYAGQEY